MKSTRVVGCGVVVCSLGAFGLRAKAMACDGGYCANQDLYPGSALIGQFMTGPQGQMPGLGVGMNITPVMAKMVCAAVAGPRFICSADGGANQISGQVTGSYNASTCIDQCTGTGTSNSTLSLALQLCGLGVRGEGSNNKDVEIDQCETHPRMGPPCACEQTMTGGHSNQDFSATGSLSCTQQKLGAYTLLKNYAPDYVSSLPRWVQEKMDAWGDCINSASYVQTGLKLEVSYSSNKQDTVTPGDCSTNTGGGWCYDNRKWRLTPTINSYVSGVLRTTCSSNLPTSLFVPYLQLQVWISAGFGGHWDSHSYDCQGDTCWTAGLAAKFSGRYTLMVTFWGGAVSYTGSYSCTPALEWDCDGNSTYSANCHSGGDAPGE
jgi:hypothetical protein